jgi:hypothetical protein
VIVGPTPPTDEYLWLLRVQTPDRREKGVHTLLGLQKEPNGLSAETIAKEITRWPDQERLELAPPAVRHPTRSTPATTSNPAS